VTTKCAYPNCTKPARARSLCEGHYSQQRRGKPLTPLGTRTTPGGPCTHPDCNHTATIKNLCDRHYRQTHYNGTAQAQPGQPACTIPGCGRVTKAHGLCNKHDLQRRRQTNPQPKIESAPRQPQTPTKKRKTTLPKGWNKPAPKPNRAPVGADRTDLGPIPPLDPDLAVTVATKLTRWGATDLIDMILGTRQEAA
jgi:hypothetical protein